MLDRLVDGLAGGGIRMRAGVTPEEVAGLARAMTHKKALAGALGGGAKGGIDLDPADPRAGAVLRRYVEAMRPLLRTCWSAAGDLGVSEEQLASVFAELRLGLTVQALADRMPDPAAASAAIAAALRITVAGIPLGDWTAGYGAAQAAAVALAHDGRSVDGATVAVQGFGPVGATAALALRDLGARVIAMADADGLLVHAGGLDLDALVAARDGHGRLDRTALPSAYEQRPGEEWLALDVDVLVPAAVAGAIDAEGSDRVRAAVVVEAANLPTTATAQAQLPRGVSASCPTSSPTRAQRPGSPGWPPARSRRRPSRRSAASVRSWPRPCRSSSSRPTPSASRPTTRPGDWPSAASPSGWPQRGPPDRTPDVGPEQPWRRGRARDCPGSDVAVGQETPSFSAAIFVPSTRLVIFWKATSRA